MQDAAPAPRLLMLGKGWFPDQLGGLDRYYRDLLEHLPEASGVVVGGDGTLPARVAGVSRHERPLPLRILAVWQAAQRAAIRTDVVDAHFALYALAPLNVGRLRHVPVILHFQGPWADESVASGDGSGLRLRARRALERATYRRADAAITLTSAFRQVLVERYRVSPWIVSVQPPGVDLQWFTPGSREDARRQFGAGREAFVAVAVRRLVPRMGLELLIEAWRAVFEDLPAGSVLLIAGDGPARSDLERAARSGNACDSVRLLGRISDAELRELYRAADVAVVPSLAHEGFGLVVIEAAACGTPSIVTDVGGLPEAIAGLGPALVLPRGDVAAISSALRRAVNDRPGRAATRAYAERFDWAAVAERHRTVARQLLRGKRTGDVDAPKDRRLKVVYLDHTAQLSGGEIALLRLLPHLNHVQAHVLLAQDGPLVGKLHLKGISTEVLLLDERARNVHRDEVQPGVLSAGAARTTATYVLRLAHRLRALAPDLVHTNSLKSGIYGCLAARLAGVPALWHVRDRIADDYLPPAAVGLIQQMTHLLPAAVITNSRATMDTLRRPHHPAVLHGVLPEVMGFQPREHQATGGPLVFGMVGRLAPWKGQDFFLRAFAHTFPAGSEERAVLVGGALFGEHEYADGLPQLARDLGVAERVEFRGHRADVWTELANFDVLVHASITPEPFGQVILEGMAAGIPVVAANAGGPAEILRHEVTGLLYDPTDVESLGNSMRRLRRAELRRRLAGAAGAALEPYSPPVVAAQLQDLYDEVLRRRRA